jgi:hypothetical protein
MKLFRLLLLLSLILASKKNFSQVTLSGTSYSENFNGIGSGLPTGFTVRTGATATSLGTTQALTVAATAWNNTSGAFKNFASANGLASSATTADQSASTDRSLGIRQTGTFGDPGAAFTFQIVNTAGLTSFQLSFKLQSLDITSPRTTTWLVQYGLGSSPSSFTTVTTVPSTITTGTLSFTNNNVFVDFGTALDNQSQNVWIRVVTLSASTGSGNRASSAIDDFSLTYSSGGVINPSISVSPPALNGFSTAVGTPSASQSISVSGNNLTDNITITPSGAYEVSLDNSLFYPSLTLNQSGGIVSNTTVYARISSSAAQGSANGTITLTSGIATNSVSLSGVVIGLINLSTPPYAQNFNSIGSGLPAGITVKTSATTSILGTDAPFAPAPATWSNLTGGFKNFASGNNDQGVTQNTAIDRALGVRQVTATDQGVAFVFQIANTSGKVNFTLDFNLQSLDASSPRTTTWRVDYGFGVNPSTFVIPSTTGTLTTGGNTFSNNVIHVNFGNALDNQPGVITIRIVTVSPSSGTGNRASTGIDDFTLSWEDPTAKTLSLNTTAINFPTINIGTSNTATYKIVSQTNLDQPLNISTTSPYTISTDNLNFDSELSIAPADAFDKIIYVKFSPVSANVYPGTITHSSDGLASKFINLSGESIDPNALSFNFNTCTVSSIPGSGFLSINITGAQKWGCSQFGRNSTNGVDMNGFSNGSVQTDDAWLISPALNLNNIVNLPVLSFYSRGEFNGPKLRLYVSTTYDGSSVPDLGDWTELAGNFPTPPGKATTVWTLSDNIDLSAYKSAAKLYIAFRYTSSPELNGARWSLDDVAITDQSTLLTVTPGQLNFGEVSVGSNSPGQAVTFKAIGSQDVSITPPNGYQLSMDNVSFTTSSFLIDQATAAAGTTFYVRFSPTEKALKIEGNVSVTAEGLNKDIVSVTGSSFPKAETFDIACYNLAFFGSNSTNTATPEDVATKVANISTVMQHLNSDVIGIEEMSNDDALAQLMATLPGYAPVISNRWSYSFNPPDPTFPPQKIGFIYNTATMSLSEDEPPRVMFESMYDSARLNLLGHRLADYPTGTPSSFWASGRLPYIATFNATVDGASKKIRVIVIHAKSGGDTDGYVRRQYDVKVLKDSLDAFYSNDKVIIVGDYNDRVVTSIFTGHSSSYQPFVDDNSNYDILTQPLDAAGRASFPGDAGMIDHITITNDLINEYISNSTDIEDARTYIPNYNATTGSDHLPVFSRFQFCKLTCPPNITKPNDAGQCGATVNFDVGSAMTCGTVTAVPSSGSFFPVGTTTVHVTAASGDTCSFTVTVNDEEAPTISAPGNITVNADQDECSVAIGHISLGTPDYHDNCDGSIVTNNAPDNFPVATTEIVWTVTDAHGHTTTTSQLVTVIDNQEPTITPPGAVNVNNDPGKCYATVINLGPSTTHDNCEVETVTNDAPVNGQFPIGTTTVTWTVTDVHGHSATASQVVTVSDNEKPVVTCPVVPVFCFNSSGSYTIPTITATDNCTAISYSYSIMGVTNRSGNTNNASGAFDPGTSTITWTVTDGAGNTSTCQTTVVINTQVLSTIPDVFAVNPGGAANTIYIGYGPTSLSLSAGVSGGTLPYSYKWTIGSSAGPALNSTSTFNVSPTTNTTYYFNVKDVYGCSASLVTKTVDVEDIRCGAKQDKVTVCQVVKGKPTTNCIATKDVSSALTGGAYLGPCVTPVTKANHVTENSWELLGVSASPNPSSNYFTLKIAGGNMSGKLSVRVTDVVGRTMERRENLQPNTILTIGHNYLPGIYFVQVIQGTSRKQIKLVKAGN